MCIEPISIERDEQLCDLDLWVENNEIVLSITDENSNKYSVRLDIPAIVKVRDFFNEITWVKDG